MSALSLGACAEAGGDDDDDNDTRFDGGGGDGDGGGGQCSNCGAGSMCCGGFCTDTQTNRNNCGLCGRPCAAMETCVAGECVCAATGGECDGTTSCCSTGCVETGTDTQNCGSCGMTCDAGDVCAGGVCDCSFTCPAPLPFTKPVCCGDGCYDICSDPAHCGGCTTTACETCDLGGCDGGFPDLMNCFFSM